MEMEIGTLFSFKKMVLEVCAATDMQCRDCVGYGKPSLCHKMPFCYTDRYFKQLNRYEVRQAEKSKKTIINI